MNGDLSISSQADLVVVGGGTAGAVVAARLAATTDRSVILLEAGPDYGPLSEGNWPVNLVEARALGYSDAWEYDSGETYPGRVVPFERAKVIGGCSSHNGCAAIWGSRLDYDGWAAQGNTGWAADDLLPFFRRVSDQLRVRNYSPDEVTPFHAACLAAAEAIGIPLVSDLNNLDEPVGMAPSPVNIIDGVRWNTAFAYLDPVRQRSNLTIMDHITVDRVIVDQGRVVEVVGVGRTGPFRIAAEQVVLAAGTYGSPAILLRSGIGDPDELRRLGVTPVHPLRGVGKGLHDHPSIVLDYAGSPALERQMMDFASQRWMPEEQSIAKLRSEHCTDGFDLHLYPVGGSDSAESRKWQWKLPVACMTPRSRGSVRLRSPDPLVPPRIDHCYLSDAEQQDRDVLVSGVKIARQVARQPGLRDLLGEEIAPGSACVTAAELQAYVTDNVVHYYHPVGTCAMGTAPDRGAVVNPRGQVFGVDNLLVADCSIMPTIPRANTNVPTAVIGERIAEWLVGATP